MDKYTADTRMMRLPGDEPFDMDKAVIEYGFDSSATTVLPLGQKPARKPRTPTLTKKDGNPEMSTVTVSQQPVISAQREYAYVTPVDNDDDEIYSPVHYDEGPTATDRILRKVALYTIAAMVTLFLIALCVNLVINDPMILIPFFGLGLGGFAYARMEWQVKRKFRLRKERKRRR